VESVTHNCKLFCCELPSGVIMRIPIGHHIHMSRDVEGLLYKQYHTFGGKIFFRILPFNVICSDSERRSSRKPLRFEEQIMSKDKYLSIFSC